MTLMIRRVPREIAYCAVSAVHGWAGLCLLMVWLLPGMAVSLTVFGTVAGVFFVIGALIAARLLGGLQRWNLARIARVSVDPPPAFSPGRDGAAMWLQRRLTDPVAWRSAGYLLIRLPVAAIQSWAVGFAVFGVTDFLYPVFWRFVHARAVPVRILSPFPMAGLSASSWPGAFAATGIGAGFVVVAIVLARGTLLTDAWLARALLGPGSVPERVRELERTRSLAVDSAADAMRRVERDLHDGAQVRLTALALHLGMAREKAADPAPDLGALRELLANADTEARRVQSELRDLARGIHPPVLDDGLPAALASLAAASALPVTVSIPGALPRASPAIETIAYFCAAELIANAAKHSFANSVSVAVSSAPGMLVIRVSDDGVGGADPARGSGLAGLAERTAVVDGVLDLSSPPGGPTVVTVELPMEA